jgi:hypothetical protein
MGLSHWGDWSLALEVGFNMALESFGPYSLAEADASSSGPTMRALQVGITTRTATFFDHYTGMQRYHLSLSNGPQHVLGHAKRGTTMQKLDDYFTPS